MWVILDIIIITLLVGGIYLAFKAKIGYVKITGIYINGIDNLINGIEVIVDFNPEQILIGNFKIPVKRVKGIEFVGINSLNKEHINTILRLKHQPEILSIYYLNKNQEERKCLIALKSNNSKVLIKDIINKINSTVGYSINQQKHIEI